jgi:hypothetical protein
MHPKILLSGLSILLPLTQAQTTTLPALLAVFPHCALGCLASAATSINCAATDFACLCSKSSDLVSKVGPCIISGSGCSPGDINRKPRPPFPLTPWHTPNWPLFPLYSASLIPFPLFSFFASPNLLSPPLSRYLSQKENLTERHTEIRNLAPSLCNIVNADKNATDVSAASNLVSAALATVTGTPTASGNAAVRTGAALGVMGMGIAGAVAVLGL